MKKLFTHIVILLLLLISPLSFSTDKIRDFYVNATVNSPIKETRKTSIFIANRVIKLFPLNFASSQPFRRTVSLQKSFLNEVSRIIEHSRAPPSAHSV